MRRITKSYFVFSHVNITDLRVIYIGTYVQNMVANNRHASNRLKGRNVGKILKGYRGKYPAIER